jgi:pimeloyl-ACP methyl ester carboxylesterase
MEDSAGPHLEPMTSRVIDFRHAPADLPGQAPRTGRDGAGNGERVMERRNVLKSVASAVTGAGLIASGRAEARTGPQPGRKAGPRTPSIVTDDGVSLFYRDWGTGRPVVFVHAWALSSDFWEYQMVHLADAGLRCVAYDRRSHGRSSDPGRGCDFDRLADDLATVIEALELRDVTLVGHSMGGGEVIRYLSRHGAGRVARAVLIAPTAPLLVKKPDYPEGLDAGLLDGVRSALARDRAKWAEDNNAPFWLPETSPEMMQWGRRMFYQCSLKAMLDATRIMTETDFRAELRRISVPMLIVHGTADRSVLVRFGRLAAALVPGCRFEEYEGAPHGLPITHMERLNRDLVAFVKG